MPVDGSDPLQNIEKIRIELARFSASLARKECWLVLNKIDLLSDDQLQVLRQRIETGRNGSAPVFAVSAVSGEGLDSLCEALMGAIEQHRRKLREDAEYLQQQLELDNQMEQEIRESVRRARPLRRRKEGIDELEDLDF